MKRKKIISVKMQAIIWILGVMIFCNFPAFCQMQLPSSHNKGIPPIPMGSQKNLGPNFARFFLDNEHTVLWGKEDGLKLLDIDEKKELNTALSGKQITALRVNPEKPNTALAATNEGDVFFVFYDEDSGFTCEKISELSSDPVGIIRQIIFFKHNPSIVLAADSKSIYRSRDAGRTWEMQNPIKLPDPNRSIICIMQSPGRRNSFLVSSSEAGRYLCKWTGNELVSVPEKAIPHGYAVIKNGISFIPIGVHSDVFPFKFEKLLILDAVNVNNLVYAVGIGKSPIKYSIDKARITIKFINQRLRMTYSIDVTSQNSKKLLIASSNGLFLSDDGGTSWSSVQLRKNLN